MSSLGGGTQGAPSPMPLSAGKGGPGWGEAEPLLASPCPLSSAELRDAWDTGGPKGSPSLENFSCSNLRGEVTHDVVKRVAWRLDFGPGSASDWLETLGKSLNLSASGK